jgi:hypothetical protein
MPTPTHLGCVRLGAAGLRSPNLDRTGPEPGRAIVVLAADHPGARPRQRIDQDRTTMTTSSPDDTPSPARRRRAALAAAAVAAVAATLTLTGVAAADPTTDGACDGSGWQVAGASVEGAPNAFDAGDAGRTYLWHDHGWHLRTTDRDPAAHLYTGTITASPGARFVGVTKVRFDPADRLWVDDHKVLHYAFVTHAGIDGIDFHVAGCATTDRQTLTFALRKNGTAEPALIDLGQHRSHPDSDPFTASRG